MIIIRPGTATQQPWASYSHLCGCVSPSNGTRLRAVLPTAGWEGNQSDVLV